MYLNIITELLYSVRIPEISLDFQEHAFTVFELLLCFHKCMTKCQAAHSHFHRLHLASSILRYI